MSMILAVMYREYRIRTTSFTWSFYDLVMPLIYLLVFGIGLDTAFAGGVVIGGTTLSYNSFFLAGVLSMACFGIAINTSYGFFIDRDNGIFYEFLTYPMTRGQFLVGKILFNCLLSLVQSIITITLGVALLEIPIRWELLGWTLSAVVLGTAGWFFFLTIFALRIRRNDMFNAFLNVAYFVLLFASSLFYPVERMPGWLKTCTYINPVTWHTDILRFATLGVGAVDIILLEVAGFGVFLLISFWFAVRTVNYSVIK
jgi:ABC-2 type transport system permease protein